MAAQVEASRLLVSTKKPISNITDSGSAVD